MCAQLYFPPCVLCRGHTASHQYKPWGRKEMTMQWTITNRRDCRLPLSEGFYTSLQCWIAHIITTCRGSLLLVVIQQQALVRGTITELQDVSSMKVVVSRGGIRRKRGRKRGTLAAAEEKTSQCKTACMFCTGQWQPSAVASPVVSMRSGHLQSLVVAHLW